MGLRYWNYTSETGENEWQFESRDAAGMEQVQVAEKRLFWTTLYVMVRMRVHALPAVVTDLRCALTACPLVALCTRVAAQAVARLPHALPGAPRTQATHFRGIPRASTECAAQIGLSMSATNVVGFTKSSKGTSACMRCPRNML